MSRIADLGHALQTGKKSIPFVRLRRRLYAFSLILIIVSAAGVATRGLDLGVEFEGGAVFEARGGGISVPEVRKVLEGAGVEGPTVQKVGTDGVRAETEELTPAKANEIRQAMAKELGIPAEEITTQVVGPSWGGDVTNKAVQSLIIFLVLLAFYLVIVFEWRLAVGAMVALLHDVVATIGIYAIVGFQVTPATVIGLLTILGYSIYDTVVVFDKVRENTANLRSSSRQTYADACNLAVNQTLVRSINTSVIGLLPVAALLFVGAGLLGAGVLKDLALVLFIGMAVGSYSSMCLAVPVVVTLSERDPETQAHNKRVAARQTSEARKSEDSAAADDGQVEFAKASAARAEAPRAASPGERVQPKKGGSREDRQRKGPQI
ncbi:MAG: protein translocase subunit SecF [Sporichthyaceae bacterium]